LIQKLRAGDIASTKFKHVVGVGHSFGSQLTVAVTDQHPKDFDAVVLTGFATDTGGMDALFGGFNLAIASINQPDRFAALPNGYTVGASIIGNQFGFLRHPNLPYGALVVAEATKGTFTTGELLKLMDFIAPASEFTGPIDIVNGEFDLAVCNGKLTALCLLIKLLW
jgi:pimeloyl-ACP methyl ester carboxylesterase